jgi:hypothetical protein
MCMNLIKYYIHTYNSTHYPFAVFNDFFEIRRELAARQQQMDDTVGGEGM